MPELPHPFLIAAGRVPPTRFRRDDKPRGLPCVPRSAATTALRRIGTTRHMRSQCGRARPRDRREARPNAPTIGVSSGGDGVCGTLGLGHRAPRLHSAERQNPSRRPRAAARVRPRMESPREYAESASVGNVAFFVDGFERRDLAQTLPRSRLPRDRRRSHDACNAAASSDWSRCSFISRAF